ncbi:MAG: L,D-transpeptidase family protein [Pedobacter sp.]
MKSCLFKTGCLLFILNSFVFNATAQTLYRTTLKSPPLQVKAKFDSTQVSVFMRSFPKLKRYEDELRTFYRKRDYNFAWFQDGKLIEQAGALRNRLLNLKADGVYKKLTYTDLLDSLVLEKNISVALNIKLELLLTAEYFVFSSLVWEGMDTFVSTDNNWLLPRKKVAYELYLDSLIQSSGSASTANREPVYRQYELLKASLGKYRDLDSRNVWVKILSNTNAKSSNTAFTISQVKKRLFLLEDYSAKLLDSLPDNELNLALVRFQKRHGLNPNGKIDKATLFELNTPLKTRIQQILVNMERNRWLPVTATGDYVAVNIPEFQMHVYNNDSLLWSSNAVVGKVANPTTLFYGEINQVVFSPYWNVPESIVKQEILPGIKRDSKYLGKHNMEITGRRNGLPIVRQKPGISNALGQVKFLFPNSYSIYLHDTPRKSLFNESDRAFSHGCIRVEQPEKLAAFLLKDKPQWNDESIERAMQSGREKYTSLDQKVPVFIVYLTAFIDRENKLNFRKDIYGLDPKLAATIISGEGNY